MAEQYQNGEFPLLRLEEYVQIICDQLEVLPPELIIQRLTGDGAKEDLIGPLWSLKKFVVLNEIDKELVRRDSWQGKYYQKPPGQAVNRMGWKKENWTAFRVLYGTAAILARII